MSISKENFIQEYIHGDRFAEIADFALTLEYPILTTEIFDRNGVVFCDGHFVRGLFKALQKSTRNYILITHNCDLNITEDIYSEKPACIKHWFAQNVKVKKPDLTPIPIGLEREQCVAARSIGETTYKKFCEGIDAPKKKLVYLNINHRTNRVERTPILRKLSWKWWVTRAKSRTHEQYIDDIFQHQFTLSPPGNGEDCHRTWEALYLGSIPVVKRSVMTEYFSQFVPMYLYDSVNDITRIKLNNSYNKLHTNELSNILSFSYWKEYIAMIRQGHL